MELERARSLLDAERARVQQLLADLGTDRTDDHEAERGAPGEGRATNGPQQPEDLQVLDHC